MPFDFIYNRPNRIIEKQKFYMAQSPLPPFERTPMSRFIYRSYMTLSFGSLAYALYNLGLLALGRPPPK
ncbi:hypothetical protein HMI54_007470 [Coelomomyces lativittatus]|nr:hypothetical protein HMI56_003884 [Coelomomyces lativittatus]KAJ1514393.1 hypothetical protein HMI55_004692 [Coelomomyces lativittatus]KAJ1516988.1 hypothetical protein HMI54_007470 [Coelomomyces lativittatus]